FNMSPISVGSSDRSPRPIRSRGLAPGPRLPSPGKTQSRGRDVAARCGWEGAPPWGRDSRTAARLAWQGSAGDRPRQWAGWPRVLGLGCESCDGATRTGGATSTASAVGPDGDPGGRWRVRRPSGVATHPEGAQRKALTGVSAGQGLGYCLNTVRTRRDSNPKPSDP